MKLSIFLPLPTLCFGIAAFAQDTRTVAEPVIPPACSTLKANIGRAGQSILPEDETKLDTARIQSAIDACPAGQAVVLQRAATRTDAFLSGPIRLRKGVTLVVDRGAYLYASRNPRDYDTSPGACGVILTVGGKRGCNPFISADQAPGSGVMGDGVIDGRGGEVLIGQDVTWWNLSDEARNNRYQQNPRLIQVTRSDDFRLYRITLLNAAMFFVGTSRVDGFTAWGLKIWAPQRARNTDGIDPGNSTNVTIAHCYISTGDDHIAIKAGAGPPTTHMSILHNHFYAGHGIAIGSETDGGASDILVSDLSIDGADGGLHIKSNRTRGGLVHDIVYQDVCLRDTARPIVMEANYSDNNTSGATPGEKLPVFRDIVVRNVHVEGEGRVILQGLPDPARMSIQFDNVIFDSPARIRVLAANSDVKVGPGPLNIPITGQDINVTGEPGKGGPNSCAGKFVGFSSR